MKTISKISPLFIIPLLALTMMSCIYSGNFGPAVEEERNVGDFEGIKVSSGIDVILSQGSRHEVIVKASEDIIDDVETRVDNGILKVNIDRKRWLKGGSVDVYITFVDIELLDVSAGSDVKSNEHLEFNKIEIEVSSGSDLKLDLEASSVDLRTSSGSDASLKGGARNFSAKASSGSDINAYDFEVANASAECSSGSDIKLWVTKSIEANASSGSDIFYKGNPEMKDINTSGGSDIHHRSE